MAVKMVIKKGDVAKELELSKKIAEGAIISEDVTLEDGSREVTISEAINITM